MRNNPVGIFDSGVGGLSVVAEFRSRFFNEDIIYFADTANYPYGTKDSQSVCSYVENVISFLKNQNVKAMLCACSTASAVAIPHYSGNIPLIGMFNEYLIDDIMQEARSSDILLIATDLTIKSKAFESFFYSYNSDINIIGRAANTLVNAVTECKFSEKELNPIIEEILNGLINSNLGGLIIGCTHFYHIKSFLKKFLTDIPVIEPAKSAVRKISSVLDHQNLKNSIENKGKTYCFVSGDLSDFKRQVDNVELFHGFKFIDEYLSLNQLITCV